MVLNGYIWQTGIAGLDANLDGAPGVVTVHAHSLEQARDMLQQALVHDPIVVLAEVMEQSIHRPLEVIGSGLATIGELDRLSSEYHQIAIVE